jgi:hypothetical protein
MERPLGLRVGSIKHAPPLDEPEIAEHSEMLANGRLLQAQALRNVPDRVLR